MEDQLFFLLLFLPPSDVFSMDFSPPLCTILPLSFVICDILRSSIVAFSTCYLLYFTPTLPHI